MTFTITAPSISVLLLWVRPSLHSVESAWPQV
jgi:hypothetical protein